MGSNNDETAARRTAPVPVKVNVTALAPYYNGDNSVKPCNWVKVQGPPGATMNCNVAIGGEIVGLSDPTDGSQLPGILNGGDGVSYGTNPYNPKLNDDGFTWFLIRGKNPASRKSGSQLLEVTLSVTDQDDPGNGDTGYPTFQEYWDSNPANDPDQHLIIHGYTTGAPADGLTPCCIYVQADTVAAWGVVRVQVTDGSATIIGAPDDHPQWLDVNLNKDDGCAAILLVDNKAESVKFTLGLPHAPGTDYIGPFVVTFESFST